MSIHVISPVLKKKWGSSCRKLVAIKLADVASDDGSCIYPAIQTVADECELSKRQVQRVMSDFLDDGILVLVNEGGNGPGKTTEYYLDMTVIGDLPDAKNKGDIQSPIRNVKGDTQSQKGCHTVTQPVLYPSLSKDKGSSASDEAGAEAPTVDEKKGNIKPDVHEQKPPTVSKQIWDEAIEVLTLHSKQPVNRVRSLIGKWNARASSPDDKDKLLAIVRAAAATGTHDPISYIWAAVNETWPPPPDPKNFPPEKWRRIIALVIERREWDASLGPAPGQRGCAVPAELITPQLIVVVQKPNVGKAAA